MLKKIKSFARDDAGTTAIEYGLIASGIALVIIAAVFSIGTTLVIPVYIGFDRSQLNVPFFPTLRGLTDLGPRTVQPPST